MPKNILRRVYLGFLKFSIFLRLKILFYFFQCKNLTPSIEDHPNPVNHNLYKLKSTLPEEVRDAPTQVNAFLVKMFLRRDY